MTSETLTSEPQLAARTSLRAVFRESLRLFPPAFSAAAHWLMALQIVRTAADQYFAFAMETIQGRGEEDFVLIALIVALSMIFNLLWSTLWITQVTESVMAASQGRPAERLKTLLPKYLNPLLIEQIRALAAILIRLPLLIIPALIEYIRLSFVPLVVILHSGYARGEVDALKESRRLARGRFGFLMAWTLANLLLPVLVDQLLQGEKGPYFWENPIGVILSMTFTLFIGLFTLIFLIVFFRRLKGSQAC